MQTDKILHFPPLLFLCPSFSYPAFSVRKVRRVFADLYVGESRFETGCACQPVDQLPADRGVSPVRPR